MATAQQLQPRIAPQTGAGVMGPGGIQDPKKATSGGNLMDKPLHMAVPPVAARLAPPTVPMSPAMQHPGAHQNQSPQTPEHLQVSWPSVKNEWNLYKTYSQLRGYCVFPLKIVFN